MIFKLIWEAQAKRHGRKDAYSSRSKVGAGDSEWQDEAGEVDMMVLWPPRTLEFMVGVEQKGFNPSSTTTGQGVTGPGGRVLSRGLWE